MKKRIIFYAVFLPLCTGSLLIQHYSHWVFGGVPFVAGYFCYPLIEWLTSDIK